MKMDSRYQFKKGDSVVCINIDTAKSLKLNKTYIIKELSDDAIEAIKLEGISNTWFWSGRFVLLKKVREDKLEKIITRKNFEI